MDTFGGEGLYSAYHMQSCCSSKLEVLAKKQGYYEIIRFAILYLNCFIH